MILCVLGLAYMYIFALEGHWNDAMTSKQIYKQNYGQQLYTTQYLYNKQEIHT